MDPTDGRAYVGLAKLVEKNGRVSALSNIFRLCAHVKRKIRLCAKHHVHTVRYTLQVCVKFRYASRSYKSLFLDEEEV
jgi:hypothetical protein